MDLWVARNKKGKLCLYNNKPERFIEYDWVAQRSFKLTDGFEYLKWEDEPIKVEIVKKED